MQSSLRIVCFLLLCGLAVPAVPAAALQQAEVRTLSIRDGKVLIDGRAVDPDALPATLRPDRLGDVQFSVIGEAQPIVEIGGRRYRLDGRRLVDLGATRTPVEVVFRTASTAGSEAAAVRTGGVVVTPHGTFDLQGQRLTSAAAPAIAPDLFTVDVASPAALRAAPHVSADALRARILSELPRLEVEDYLADVQRLNRGLFERLQREHSLELRSFDLAARIRGLESAGRRQALQDQLRLLLEETFALKQENRRREIEQLEAQLEALRERLEARAEHEDLIIERRLRALLGEGDDGGW